MPWTMQSSRDCQQEAMQLCWCPSKATQFCCKVMEHIAQNGMITVSPQGIGNYLCDRMLHEVTSYHQCMSFLDVKLLNKRNAFFVCSNYFSIWSFDFVSKPSTQSYPLHMSIACPTSHLTDRKGPALRRVLVGRIPFLVVFLELWFCFANSWYEVLVFLWSIANYKFLDSKMRIWHENLEA